MLSSFWKVISDNKGTVTTDADGSDLRAQLQRAIEVLTGAVQPSRLHNATSTASPDVITEVAPHIHLLPSSGRQRAADDLME